MSQLINIFLEPTKVFSEIRERPSFLLPALLVTLATALVAAFYFFRVDPAWYADYQLAAAGAQMSAAEIEQAKQFMPGARTLGMITFPIVMITMIIVYAILALYYLLAGKIAGQPVSYRHGLALAAWSSMPMLLAAVVSLVGIFISSNQASFESMQLLNIDPLFVQLPLDHPWSSFAKSFSLINFWAWFLAALGWKTWFRTGWGQALFVVMLPGVLFFGTWAAFAAF